jgi:hypothetical protein
MPSAPKQPSAESTLIKTPAMTSSELIRARILRANLPADAKSFTLAEMDAAGITASYQMEGEFRRLRKEYEIAYRLLVLALAKCKLLQAENDRLRQSLDEVQPYCSPLHLIAWNEPDPVKAAALRGKADADDAQKEAAKRQREEAEWQMIERSATSLAWKKKSRDRRPKRVKDRLWHVPMSREDYVKATGVTRRTVEGFLRSIKAKPLRSRQRSNERELFGPEINYQVLHQWLTRWTRDVSLRRIYFCCTLFHCRREAPTEAKRLLSTLMTCWSSLEIAEETPAERREFVAWLKKLSALYPPPPPNNYSDLSSVYFGIRGEAAS